MKIRKKRRKQLILIALSGLIAFSQNGLDLFSSSYSNEGISFMMVNMLSGQVTDHVGSAFILAFSQIIWIIGFILISGDELASDVKGCAAYVFSRYASRDPWIKKQLRELTIMSLLYTSSYQAVCLFIASRVTSPRKEIKPVFFLVLFLFAFLFMLFCFSLLCNLLSIWVGISAGATITFLLVFICTGVSSVSLIPHWFQWLNPAWLPVQKGSTEYSLKFILLKNVILLMYCLLLTNITKSRIRSFDFCGGKGQENRS